MEQTTEFHRDKYKLFQNAVMLKQYNHNLIDTFESFIQTADNKYLTRYHSERSKYSDKLRKISQENLLAIIPSRKSLKAYELAAINSMKESNYSAANILINNTNYTDLRDDIIYKYDELLLALDRKSKQEILRLKVKNKVFDNIVILSSLLIFSIIIFIFSFFYKLLKDFNINQLILEKSNIDLIRSQKKEHEFSNMKGEFFRNTSHELRTPLNAVCGFTDLLLDEELTTIQREHINNIKLSADMLLELINNILDFTKLEAGEAKPEKIPTNIEELAYEAATVIQAKTKKRHFEILIDVDNIWANIISDPLKLKQVFINILSNASKFTSTGFILLKITTLSEDKHNSALKFEFIDTGIGIEKRALDRIFEEFQQADGSTTRNFGGTGLGLSISRKIISLLGGDLKVESTPGKGSRFHFSLDFKKTTPDIEFGEIQKSFGQFDNYLVLIVDDNEFAREIIYSMLIRFGFKVMQFSNPRSAIEAVKKVTPDILFLDINMPEIDGFDCRKEVDMVCNKIIPAVAITADMRISTSEKLKKHNFDYYLNKPYKRMSLLKIVSEIIHGKPIVNEDSNLLLSSEALSFSANILVAEDNLMNQKLIRTYLEKMGHRSTIVENGKLSVTEVKNGNYDLVFMDMQMPVMGGVEATKEIRKFDTAIPIVATTANVSEEDMIACLNAGMNDFTTKPLNRKKLRSLIWKYCSGGINGHYIDNLRILIVDDDPVEMALLNRVVPKIYPTAQIKNAKDGLEASVLTGSFLPHIILTDIKMPNMSGIDFARFILKTPRYEKIKILFMTADDNAYENYASEIKEIKMDIMIKPLKKNQIKARLDRLILETNTFSTSEFKKSKISKDEKDCA